jgi:UrcA family protein
MQEMTMTMFKVTFTLTSTLAAALLALAATHNAAASDDGPKQQVVKFADLDLSKPEGAKALYTRLSKAARQVCSGLEGRRLDEIHRYRSCVSESVGNAVAAVNQPALTDVHLAQTGQSRMGPSVARIP